MNTTKNRETGTHITLIAEAGTHTLVCEEHDQCIEVDSLRMAREFRSVPSEWCTDCFGLKASN